MADTSLQQAVDQGEWKLVMGRVDRGISSHSRQQLCEQAAQQQQWDVVQQLVEMGVKSAVRTSLLQIAFAAGHTACVAKVIELGVCQQSLERCVRQALDGSQCDFVVQLVKTCSHPELKGLVLREAMKQNCWSVVCGLVKLGLGVSEMEKVCDEAVAHKQWSVVFQALQLGVSPSDWVVSELVSNSMTQSLLDLFPDNTMSRGLTGLLLLNAMRYSQLDMALHILKTQRVTDAELMEAMAYVVQLRSKETVQGILKCSPRSRRVFKQEFHKYLHLNEDDCCADEDDIWWVFNCLDDGGEKGLALHVAVNGGVSFLIADFFKSNSRLVDLRKKTFQNAIDNLYIEDFTEFQSVIKDCDLLESPANRRYLFQLAVRNEDVYIAAGVCGKGIRYKDLKFALPLLVKKFDFKMILEMTRKLSSELNKDYIIQLATRTALKFLFSEGAGTYVRTFLCLFGHCCEASFRRRMFKAAVRKATKKRDGSSFTLFCSRYFKGKDLRTDTALQKDCLFAYKRAVSVCQPEFLFNSFENSSLEEVVYPQVKIIIQEIFDRADQKSFSNLADLLFCVSADATTVYELVLEEFLKQERWWDYVQLVDQSLFVKDFMDVPDVNNFLLDCYVAMLGKTFSLSLSELVKWCLDHACFRFAFFLAFMMRDWQTVHMLLSDHNHALKLHLHLKYACVAADCDAFSVAAAVLKLGKPPSPRTTYKLWQPSKEKGRSLAAKCLEEGAVDWAVALTIPDWSSVCSMLEKHDSPAAVNLAVAEACPGWCPDRNWQVVRDLCARCTDHKVLQNVLARAVQDKITDVFERVIIRVDLASNLLCAGGQGNIGSHLLFQALHCSSPSLRIVHLLIAAGIASLQRQQTDITNSLGRNICPITSVLDSRRSAFAFQSTHSKVIQTVIRSGSICNMVLDGIRQSQFLQTCFVKQDRESEWAKCYSSAVEAAGTPARLEHLARLAVSHCIGHGPGRRQRIQSLGVPAPLKNLLNFQDITSDDC